MGGGVLGSRGDLRTPVFSLSVARPDVEFEGEFEWFMQLRMTPILVCRVLWRRRYSIGGNVAGLRSFYRNFVSALADTRYPLGSASSPSRISEKTASICCMERWAS
jgi:hypothetical protein